jgi:hypothetical protein
MHASDASEFVAEPAAPSREPAAGRDGGWPRRLAGAVGEHAFVLPVFLIIAVVIGWFVTQGTGKFFVVEPFGTYYDALAKSLEHGRFDVPANDIAEEAFIRDGKYYGYFGMTPALFRVPLNSLWASRTGQWSRISLLVACLASVLYTYRIVLALLHATGTSKDPNNAGPVSRDAERSASASTPLRVAANRRWGKFDRAIVALFLLCAGIGSTHVFLSARPFIYHEAIAWGSTLALASAYYLLRYLLDGRLHLLIEAGVAAFLAFFARPTAGAGAVFACGVLAMLLLAQGYILHQNQKQWNWLDRVWRALGATDRKRPLRDGIVIGACVLFTGCCYLATNYLKFRTFDGVPVKYYTQYLDDPYRMKITGGKQIHLGNFGTCFVAYFVRPGAEFRRQFPWVFMSGRRVIVGRGAVIDEIEGSSTVPGSMPWLVFLWAIGIALAVWGGPHAARATRLPILGMAIGGSVILVTVGITERYVHDIYPFFAIAAAAGVAWIVRRRNKAFKAACLGVLAITGLFAIGANCAFALEYQRDIVWGVPADRVAQFRHWRACLDGLLFGEPLKPIETADATPPEAVVPGQLWKVRQSHAIYWYNGERWQTVSSPSGADEYRLKVHFGAPPVGTLESLLTRGAAGAGDFVYVVYLSEHRVQFNFEHWGDPNVSAAPIRLVGGLKHDVRIEFDVVNGTVKVSLDGATMISARGAIRPAGPNQTWIGKNPIGGLPTKPFSGTIEPLSAPDGATK